MMIDNLIADNKYTELLNHCAENAPDFARLLSLAIAHKGVQVDSEQLLQTDSKIRVLLMSSWCPSQQLIDIWNRMSEDGQYCWKNIRIVAQEPCDYYCIINRPFPDAQYDPERTIVFRMEPYMEKDEGQWGDFAKPDTSKFKFVGYHDTHYNNNEWHLSKTYQQLSSEPVVKNPEFDRILSTILSDKYKDPGHIKRVDFIKFIENKMDVHVFGSDKFLWKNYKGSLPDHQKDDSLFPYKYSFNVENHSIKNYYTEKLIDGILAETLVFYSGCFNARDYIDERAFVYLELSNFNHDYNVIRRAIDEDWHSQRLPYIKEAKKKILNELQFFPRLDKIING
jgi:hypothetical protein